MIGIIYGALVAMVQPDLKKLVAYSSVSHLGFVMLGLFALNRRASRAASTRCSTTACRPARCSSWSASIYHRRHTRLISEFGGLWKQLPVYAVVFLIVMLSSIGLPGLNGFVGEFLILLGAFKASVPAAAVAVLGVILGAVYMLWMFQRVMFGPLDKPENQKLTDLSAERSSSWRRCW